MKSAYPLIGLMASSLMAAVALRILLAPKLVREPPPVLRRLNKQIRVFEPADVAAIKKRNDGSIDSAFIESHNQFLAQAKSNRIDLLFLGDSITYLWRTVGEQAWVADFSAYHPADFGVGGDCTQQLLWRIENGELDNIQPKAIVVLIGTNNSNYPANEIVAGVRKVVSEIRRRLPASKILLLGILPKEYFPNDPVRQKIQKVNVELSRLDDQNMIRYVDAGHCFLNPVGTIQIDTMPDCLHLSAKGYRILATAIQPTLDQMLK